MSDEDQLQDDEQINLMEIQEEEDNNEDIIEIQLDSNIVEVNYSQLYKYSQLIKKEISIKQAPSKLPKLINKYKKEYEIQEKNIVIFFNIIQDKNAKINSTSYCDLFKLSSLLKVSKLQNFLKKFAQKHSNDVTFISKLITEQRIMQKFGFSYDTEKMEEMKTNLASQIKECLTNENFNKLPNSIVHKIIEKSDKQLLESNSLYDFIKNSINYRYDLFQYIDLETLSDDRIKDIFDHYQDEMQISTKQRYYQNIGKIAEYLISIRKSRNELIQINIEYHQKLDDLLSKNEHCIEVNQDLNAKLIRLKEEADNLQQKASLMKTELNEEEVMKKGKIICYEIIKELIDRNEDILKDYKMAGILNIFFCL